MFSRMWSSSIDNHSSGYLGMAVEHCVSAYLGSHCILAQKRYCQKLMAQLNSTAFFSPVTYVYFEAIKLFMKNFVTVKVHFTRVLFSD